MSKRRGPQREISFAEVETDNWKLRSQHEHWTLNINGQQNFIQEHFALRRIENWKCIEIAEVQQKRKWNTYLHQHTKYIKGMGDPKGREWEREKNPTANITLYVKLRLFNFKSKSYVKLFILKIYNYCNCIKESVVYAICWDLCTQCACFFFNRFLYFVVAFNDFDIKTVLLLFFAFFFILPVIMCLGVSESRREMKRMCILMSTVDVRTIQLFFMPLTHF